MTAPRWLPLTTMLLSGVGLVVAGYLTYEHYSASTTLACPDTGVVNCLKVTTSEQSALFGIPVAVLGAGYFAAMLALGVPAAWKIPALRWGRVGFALVGVVMVLYLVYAELFILDAICLWCTAVHVLAVALFVVVAFGTASATD